MCELTLWDYIRIFEYYWANRESVQIKMELWAVFIENALGFVVLPIILVTGIYHLWRDWNKYSLWIRIIVIVGELFFVVAMILAYPQAISQNLHYGCRRKYLLSAERIDTVLGYVYEYEYACYRRRIGGGYVKYRYYVPGVNLAVVDSYNLEGNFICDVDTGYYYVIIPDGKWDSGIILLDKKVSR